MNRYVSEGTLKQGVNEQISYQIVTTPWGRNPTSGSVWITDITDGGIGDVTSAVMPTGSVNIVGDIITLPLLRNLVVNRTYRINTQFNIGTNQFVCLAVVQAEY